MVQQRLVKGKVKYHSEPYNKFDDTEQWIRITDGCPNNCPYCYAPQELKIYPIPEIVRNQVKIMDMNLLAQPKAIDIIEELGSKKVNNKIVYYELVCGIDYRFITKQIADILKVARFINIRLAWDWFYKDQMKIKDSINMLLKAGYRNKDIMIFMICNWKISYKECCNKLDLCKIWNVQVSDCWFNNQTAPNIVPEHWNAKEIKEFRSKCRKHNQLVNFKIDPEVK